MTCGFNRTGNFKTDHPHVTVVSVVLVSRVEMLKTMIDAYVDDLPTDLVELLNEVRRQLP